MQMVRTTSGVFITLYMYTFKLLFHQTCQIRKQNDNLYILISSFALHISHCLHCMYSTCDLKRPHRKKNFCVNI